MQVAAKCPKPYLDQAKVVWIGEEISPILTNRSTVGQTHQNSEMSIWPLIPPPAPPPAGAQGVEKAEKYFDAFNLDRQHFENETLIAC
jgi:hypothetical protein